jgi:hypothetical protein
MRLRTATSSAETGSSRMSTVGADGEGAGDGHALALAAGDFVRVAREDGGGGRSGRGGRRCGRRGREWRAGAAGCRAGDGWCCAG